jgi:hypothetical protein
MVLAAAVAALVAPAAAHAGTYDVVACNAPGAGGANNSWAGQFTSFNNQPEPQNYDIYDSCRGAEKGLVARTHVGGSGNAGFLTGAAWTFTAPAGTTITRVTVWRYGIKYRTGNDDPNTDGDDGDTWFLGAQEFNGNTVGGGFGETCNVPAGGTACTLGVPGGASAANQKTYDVSTTLLKWQIFCRQLFGTGGCPRYFGVSTAEMTLFGAQVTLTDTSAPSLAVDGPALGGGWHRPGDAITLSASDNSGIRNARAEAGGAVSGGARSCDATRTVPCSNVSGGTLALPAAPDGTQNVHIVAEDAAGNATAADRTVLIDGTAPLARLERAHGRVLRVHVEDAASGVAGGEISAGGRALPTTLKRGILRARLDRGRVSKADVRVRVRDNAGNEAAGAPPRITVGSARIGRRVRRVRSSRLRLPFGRRAVLRGRMTLSDGTPVAGAPVRVVARVRRPGAPLRAVATVTTDRRGRFSAPVKRGPSRTVGLRFDGRGDILRAARGVGVRVPAASTIHASRRFLSGPGRVRFSGRMRTGGQRIPDRGLVVILQGREDGRWRTFADTRTNRRGRWKAGYRFRGVPGSYPVRARIRRQAGYPYELGYSRAVAVRVG